MNLRDCYDAMVPIFDGPDSAVEPFDSVALVDQYRMYFRPRRVKVILLAESHVYTSAYDAAVATKPIPGLVGFPDRFARFVYCPAYGEGQLIEGNIPKNQGTSQYWKLLYSCANYVTKLDDCDPVLKRNTSSGDRLSSKIELLLKLQRCGVWLVDSSVMALYKAGSRPKNTICSLAISMSWDGYVKSLVLASNPEHLVVVGRGVARTLEPELLLHFGADRYTVIDQPNAHLSTDGHIKNLQTCFSVCEKYGANE